MIHMFTLEGRTIVLDVHSGSIHTPDALACQIIQLRQNCPGQDFKTALAGQYDAAEIEEAAAEVDSLVREGLLFSEAPPAAAIRQPAPVIKALCLHVAHACNLRCAYCFAGQGTYQGEHALMSLETGKKAIDFLIQHSGNRRNLEVDFFGGEPLLNLDTVKGIVAYARSQEKICRKSFRFTLTTNGLGLDDETIAYLDANMDNVVLSLDGRKVINDTMRQKPDGQGCYDEIVPLFQKLARTMDKERYYIRGTYTRKNLDFCADVLHLIELGFTRISVEPVVAALTEPYAIRPEEVPALCLEYEKLASALWKQEKAGCAVDFFHFQIDLSGGPCLTKRITGCGAGTEYLAVTPDGSLFPCHQFVGEDAFCMGHLKDGITKPTMVKTFAGNTVLSKPECAGCWAKFYCSGGCAANAYHCRGDIALPDETGCALQRKRIECALYLLAEKADGL